jgi:hypothetical protein
MTPLPSFERTRESPALPPAGSALVIAKSGDGVMSDVLLHGSYRVVAEDRALLGPHRIRHQVWLLAVHRTTRAVYFNRPGGESVVFNEEEPPRGPVEGWFQVQLSGAAGIPSNQAGVYDVTALLGPIRSAPLAVTLRSASR